MCNALYLLGDCYVAMQYVLCYLMIQDTCANTP